MKLLLSILFLLHAIVMTARIRHYGSKDGLDTGEVMQAIELPNGQLLVNTVGSFKLFDGTRFRTLPCDISRLPTLAGAGRYGHLWQGDSLLWLRDFYYIYLFDAQRREFRYDISRRLAAPEMASFVRCETSNEPSPGPEWNQLLQQHGISGDVRICTILEDRQQGIWMGTQGDNLFYIPPSRPQALTIPCPGGKQPQVVSAVSRDELLVGTEEGLWLLHLPTRTFSLLKGDSPSLYHSSMTDSKGRIWVCSQKGVDCYAKGRIAHYDKSNIRGFLHDHVLFVRELADGRLLACNNYHAVGILDVERGLFSVFPNMTRQLGKSRVVIDALQLEDGRILVLTQNGIFTFNPSSGVLKRMKLFSAGLSNKINCALQDSSGQLWIGTQSGLALVTDRGRTEQVVMDACVRGLAIDGKGRLWVALSDGVARISRLASDAPFRICRFASADGIPTAGIRERLLFFMEPQRLCMASLNGITLFPAALYDSLSRAQPLVLTSVETPSGSWPSDLSSLVLDHQDNSLKMTFSDLNYAFPEHTLYRYRLRGLSDEWVYTRQGEAAFTLLPFGRYVFEVQTAILDGMWGPVLAKQIKVRPPLWLSWWACLLYGLLSLLLICLFLSWCLKRIEKHLVSENDARVLRLFALRDRARRQFAQSIQVNPKAIAVDSREEETMVKVIAAIDRQLGNSDYTVDKLASDVCMSRASLYRCMQNMLGITPNEFIRNVRLKHAARMLEETDLSISVISERVGFGSPRYFTQHFKRIFGVLPSEYRMGTKKEEPPKE